MGRKNKIKYQQLRVDDEEIPPKKGKKQQRLGANNRRKSRQRNSGGDDETFRRTLEEDGTKTIADMAADGNCLFRALSDQIYWDYGDNHEEVRSEICDFLALHEEEFSVFLVLDENEDDEDAADFESYISTMRTSGEWGGNLELVAAARLYRRNIKVFSAAVAYTIEHGAKNSAAPDLMVSYHDNDHYNSLRGSKAKKPPPPVKMMPARVQTSKSVSVESSDTAHTEEESCLSSDAKDETTNDEKAEQPSEGADPTTINKSGKRKCKKGGPCPCGSGKTFRKCCRDKEKAAARKSVPVFPDETGKPEPSHEHEVESGFKVLKI